MNTLTWVVGLLVVLVIFNNTTEADGEQPRFQIRGTLPWHNFLSGPTAWDEEDYARYLDRMQALGLNYITFHCYTGGAERYAPYVEPLIRLQYRDVVPEAGLDTSLTARWGYRPMAVSDFVFGTDSLFHLPPGAKAFGAQCAVTATNKQQAYDQAQALMRRVLEMAHARGIQVGMGFEFGIHPPEFASIVPPQPPRSPYATVLPWQRGRQRRLNHVSSRRTEAATMGVSSGEASWSWNLCPLVGVGGGVGGTIVSGLDEG